MTHTNNKMMRTKATDFLTHRYPVSLEECYKDYSYSKGSAYGYCMRLANEYNADKIGITGHNCMTFTFCFTGEEPTTHRKIFAFITKDYDRFIYLDEVEA